MCDSNRLVSRVGGTLKGGHVKGRQELRGLTRVCNNAVLPFYMHCSYYCCFSCMHVCVRAYIVIFINSLKNIK